MERGQNGGGWEESVRRVQDGMDPAVMDLPLSVPFLTLFSCTGASEITGTGLRRPIAGWEAYGREGKI